MYLCNIIARYMGLKGKTKINIERLKILYSLGYNDIKISEHLKCSKRTVAYVRKEILKYPIVAENIKLSKRQENILVGTLLGDSYIGYTHKDCRYPNITFSHCKKQELYARTKYNNLKIIMSSIKERKYKDFTFIKGVRCNVQSVIFCTGRNVVVLEKYRNIFYPKNKKIIPISFLENTFNDISLAYLFMDDGCRNGKTYNLNLQNFETENLLEFIDFLKRKFNLDFILKKDKTLYLRYKSVEIFEKLIKPHITKDMEYKLKSSLNLVNLGKSGSR